MTGQITTQLIIASGLIVATTAIHGVWIGLGNLISHALGEPLRGRRALTLLLLMLTSLWLFVAHLASVFLWGGAFMHLGVSGTLEEGLYFAMATYTTLGFGDVLAPQPYRLLTGAAAMNGLLLFGLSAAVLVEAATANRKGG